MKNTKNFTFSELAFTEDINISPFHVFKYLIKIVVSLTLAGFLVVFANSFIASTPILEVLSWFLNPDKEGNLPTLFSCLLLVSNAAIFLFLFCLKNQIAHRFRYQYLALSLIFLFLFWDEATEIHERLMNASALYKIMDLMGLDRAGALTFPWVLMAIALLPVLALFFSRFLFYFPSFQRKILIIAFSLYVLGAVGMEMVGGMILGDVQALHSTDVVPSFLYIVSFTIEEFLEMAALSTLSYALLLHLGDAMQGRSISISPK